MDLIDNIKKGQDIRKSLIEIKKTFDKDSYIQDEQLKEKLVTYLQHEDPKVRKNAAELLGNYEETVPLLLHAYQNENIEYVKEAYLKGISKQDSILYIKDLKKIQSDLLSQEDVSVKHIQAQLKILNPLLLKYQSHKKKIIKLKHDPVDVILTTLPYYQFVVFDHIPHLRYKTVSQGVLVRTNSLYDLLSIRVYKDMLLPLGASYMKQDIQDIQEHFKHFHLLEILNKLYDETSFFYYKVTDGLREKNPQLIKQVSQAIFELYPQKLLNSSQKYDIEILLKEVKKGTVNAYLKLSHLENPRFSYRKNTIPTSMNPYVAATLVQLSEPYMKENAKVLDPFVGIGTLLIEKNMKKPSQFSIGIDIFKDAIEIAKKNTKIAKQSIYYIHKDTLRFSHSELFDEIITDMPTFAQMKDEEKLKNLYDRFFARIPRLIKPGGYIFIYTSEIALVRKNLRLHDDYLSLDEHFEIPRGKNMFYYFIIKRK